MPDRKLDIVDAARYLNVSSKTIRRYIDSGKLTAEKIKNVWYLSVDDLDALNKKPKRDAVEKTPPASAIEEYMARLDVVLTAMNDKISGINSRLDLVSSGAPQDSGVAAVSDEAAAELEMLRGENERLASELDRVDREHSAARENGSAHDPQALKNKSEEIEELRAIIVSNRRGLSLLREEVARYKEELRRRDSVVKDLKARVLELEQELAEYRLGRKGSLLLGRRRD